MLFEICQGFLMWEDLRFRSVSPTLCLLAIVCAVFQGGSFVVLASLLSLCLLIPTVFKQMIGLIDIVFLGIYSGLLADVMMIGCFFSLAGFLGILWTFFKKTPIPLMTMMGASYALVINMR